MRVLAILTVRNEGAFLLEWLAHHSATGFTDFLVFSNDCDDGTDAMLDRLDAMGRITHVRNTEIDDSGVQWSALKRADKHPLTQAADWIAVLDVDEFVNIHAGAGRIGDLLEAVPEASAIALTWRIFGNDGVDAFEDASVTGQFTRAGQNPPLWPWRLGMFKTLFRNDGIYRKLGVHRPRNPDRDRLDEAQWVDGSGRALPAIYRSSRLFTDFRQDCFGLVQLNHYPLGAMQSYILKCDRGRPNRSGSATGMSYWVERNLCHVEDRSVLAHWPRVEEALQRLKSDPELARLHDAACAWRGQRFEALMRDEDLRALYGHIRICPPTRAITRTEAARLMAWARKAHAESQDR
ncbi:glycosyl transferase family 2 [Maritimibacter sp. 55A14]|nr:glycosyl transferase family 2 [Maritimibacter sp. 55A14]